MVEGACHMLLLLQTFLFAVNFVLQSQDFQSFCWHYYIKDTVFDKEFLKDPRLCNAISFFEQTTHIREILDVSIGCRCSCNNIHFAPGFDSHRWATLSS